MRQYLAVIFMVIFSFQVLPVRVLGKLLAKGQTQEEVKSCDSDDDCGAAKYLDLIAYEAPGTTTQHVFITPLDFIVHRSSDLPPSYVTEIIPPPPNC